MIKQVDIYGQRAFIWLYLIFKIRPLVYGISYGQYLASLKEKFRTTFGGFSGTLWALVEN